MPGVVPTNFSGTEWVNPEDPNVIAENELLGAAASIEAAARKLAELKPRQRPKVSHFSLVLFLMHFLSTPGNIFMQKIYQLFSVLLRGYCIENDIKKTVFRQFPYKIEIKSLTNFLYHCHSIHKMFRY